MTANAAQIATACLALVILTFIVGARLLFNRIQEMREKRIRPQEIATSAQMAARLENIQAADNFRDLFEAPVPFYALAAVVLTIAFVFTFAAAAQNAEYSKAISIIEEEGQFLFTDGSSYYLFFKGGNFDSGPLTLSGRSIQGTWKQSGDYQFIIEGKWSWLNGAHPLNDKRRLVMNIQPPCVYQPDESKNTFIPRHMTKPPRIYKCYFTIEELVKTGDKK